MDELLKQLKIFDKIDAHTVIVFILLSGLVLISLFVANIWPVFLCILLISSYFIWQTPQAGFLALLLTTMIFGEHFSLLPLQINEVIYKIYLLDFVLIVSFLFWLLQQKVEKINFKKFFANKINLSLIIFWFFIFINLIISLFFKGANASLAIGTFKNYSYLFVYFVVVLMFNNKESILKILKIFLYGGLIILFFIFYGWITGRGLWSEITPGLHYLSGLHTYYLSFSLIILLVVFAYKKYVFNFFSDLLIFVLQFLGLVGGMFRHLWLAVVVSFLFIFRYLKLVGKSKIIKIAGIIIFAGLFLILITLWFNGILGKDINFTQNIFFKSVVGRSLTLFETGNSIESAAGWRLATWQVALDKFLSSPILGIGLGQRFYFEYLGFIDIVDIRNIHNDFASLLVQLGLLGFLPFILFNFYIFKNLIFLIKSKDNFEHEIALIVSGFYIIALFGIFFAIYLMFNGTSIFFWAITAMVTILTNNEKLKVKN